jgi:hypothetical protein
MVSGLRTLFFSPEGGHKNKSRTLESSRLRKRPWDARFRASCDRLSRDHATDAPEVFEADRPLGFGQRREFANDLRVQGEEFIAREIEQFRE